MGKYVFNRSRPGKYDEGLDIEAALKYNGPWPAVTCICPTYGRFRVVRDAIACFVLQDYPGEHKLLISNDAPTPLRLTEDYCWYRTISKEGAVRVRNGKPYPSVGVKKQALLDSVTTEFVAHWEDDDLYLPWHLKYLISVLMTHPHADCVKPFTAWRIQNQKHTPAKRLVRCAIYKGRYDGQMIFRNGTSVPYSPDTRSIELPLIKDYFKRGKMVAWAPAVNKLGYVYRLHAGLKQLCRTAKKDADGVAEKRWKKHNRDFGDGPLLPNGDLVGWSRAQLQEQLALVLQTVKNNWPNGKLRVPHEHWPTDEDVFGIMCKQLPWVAERLTE